MQKQNACGEPTAQWRRQDTFHDSQGSLLEDEQDDVSEYSRKMLEEVEFREEKEAHATVAKAVGAEVSASVVKSAVVVSSGADDILNDP